MSVRFRGYSQHECMYSSGINFRSRYRFKVVHVFIADRMFAAEVTSIIAPSQFFVCSKVENICLLHARWPIKECFAEAVKSLRNKWINTRASTEVHQSGSRLTTALFYFIPSNTFIGSVSLKSYAAIYVGHPYQTGIWVTVNFKESFG